MSMGEESELLSISTAGRLSHDVTRQRARRLSSDLSRGLIDAGK